VLPTIVGSRAASASVFDTRAVGSKEAIAHDIKCIRWGLERLEGRSNIFRSADFEWRDFDAECASRGLKLAHLQHALGVASIPHNCQPAETWDNLSQEFEPLTSKVGILV
jgi:hypothetical protein